jgi:putative inorganic carbon (HCO3(-)) transporter
MFDITTLLVTFAIITPAFLLLITQSSYIVDYAIFVVAFNRMIRRMVDYYNEDFNQYSTISLTPLIACGLLMLGFMFKLNRLDISERQNSTKVLKIYVAAVVFAFLVGLYRNRLSAVHALGDYLAPVGLLGYGILYCNDPRTINRWCLSTSFACLGVAIYGIWQFYTIPPWDAFWLVETGMEGYLGTPEPMKMTMFSTMQERGPVSVFLVGGLFILLFRSGNHFFKWPAIALIVTAILLTSVRTAVVQLAIAVIIFPLINRGVSIAQTAIVSILLTVFVSQTVELVPGFTRVSDRLATLSDLPNDGSIQGRIQLFFYAASNSVTEPLGTGLGSMGVAASRVGGMKTGVISEGTGYMSLLQTFGWIGFVAIVSVMWRIWRSTGQVLSFESNDQNVMLLRAWFISGVVAFLAGDWLFSASFFWVLAGYSLGIADRVEYENEVFEDDSDTVGHYEPVF